MELPPLVGTGGRRPAGPGLGGTPPTPPSHAPAGARRPRSSRGSEDGVPPRGRRSRPSSSGRGDADERRVVGAAVASTLDEVLREEARLSPSRSNGEDSSRPGSARFAEQELLYTHRRQVETGKKQLEDESTTQQQYLMAMQEAAAALTSPLAQEQDGDNDARASIFEDGSVLRSLAENGPASSGLGGYTATVRSGSRNTPHMGRDGRMSRSTRTPAFTVNDVGSMQTEDYQEDVRETKPTRVELEHPRFIETEAFVYMLTKEAAKQQCVRRLFWLIVYVAVFIGCSFQSNDIAEARDFDAAVKQALFESSVLSLQRISTPSQVWEWLQQVLLPLLVREDSPVEWVDPAELLFTRVSTTTCASQYGLELPPVHCLDTVAHPRNISTADPTVRYVHVDSLGETRAVRVLLARRPSVFSDTSSAGTVAFDRQVHSEGIGYRVVCRRQVCADRGTVCNYECPQSCSQDALLLNVSTMPQVGTTIATLRGDDLLGRETTSMRMKVTMYNRNAGHLLLSLQLTILLTPSGQVIPFAPPHPNVRLYGAGSSGSTVNVYSIRPYGSLDYVFFVMTGLWALVWCLDLLDLHRTINFSATFLLSPIGVWLIIDFACIMIVLARVLVKALLLDLQAKNLFCPFFDYPGADDALTSTLFVLYMAELFRYLEFSDTLNLLTESMRKCLGYLLPMLILFIVWTVGYGLAGMYFFGAHTNDFTTLDKATATMFGMLLGTVTQSSLTLHGRDVTHGAFAACFYYSYVAVGLLLFLNTFVAVAVQLFRQVGDAFERSKAQSDIAESRLAWGSRDPAASVALASGGKDSVAKRVRDQFERLCPFRLPFMCPPDVMLDALVHSGVVERRYPLRALRLCGFWQNSDKGPLYVKVKWKEWSAWEDWRDSDFGRMTRTGACIQERIEKVDGVPESCLPPGFSASFITAGEWVSDNVGECITWERWDMFSAGNLSSVCLSDLNDSALWRGMQKPPQPTRALVPRAVDLVSYKVAWFQEETATRMDGRTLFSILRDYVEYQTSDAASKRVSMLARLNPLSHHSLFGFRQWRPKDIRWFKNYYMWQYGRETSLDQAIQWRSEIEAHQLARDSADLTILDEELANESNLERATHNIEIESTRHDRSPSAISRVTTAPQNPEPQVSAAKRFFVALSSSGMQPGSADWNELMQKVRQANAFEEAVEGVAVSAHLQRPLSQ